MVQRQSKFVIAPLLTWWTAAGRAIFAPMQLCTGGGGGSWPEAVRLEAAAGSQAEGMAAAAGRQYPPSRLYTLERYRVLECRNFFLSFGSPRSVVLANSGYVSCCVCVDREEVDK